MAAPKTLQFALGLTAAFGATSLFLPACGESSDPQVPPLVSGDGGGNASGGQGSTVTGGSNGTETGGSPSSGGAGMATGGTFPGTGGADSATGGGDSGTGGWGDGSDVEHPDPLTSGCDGYTTRYWDCCKPHCAWPGNVGGAGSPMRMCNANNQALHDADASSSCDGGPAHVCYDNAPWAVSNTLSYGYAATGAGDVCGRCFQITFKGTGQYNPEDPGSQALASAGKQMIVQATNIGYDVGGGQFDLMIPGGGVGAFNGCSNQWGTSDLGPTHGGFLAACEQSTDNSHNALKNCVRQKCSEVFGSRGDLGPLLDACNWFIDWFEVANNPQILYREVACPEVLTQRTGMSRGSVESNCGG